MPRTAEPILPFSPVRNSELFANHWLERRLRFEPEWLEHRDQAARSLDEIAALWTGEREFVERYAEAELERTWVQPVFDSLGWRFSYQTSIQGRHPDYALFLTEEDQRASARLGRNSPDFWQRAKVVGDAKAWPISLDRPSTINNQREYPPEQIEWYVNRTGLDWGLLTNGRIWRLSPRELRRHQPRFQTYLEIDLPLLIDRWIGTNGSRERRSVEVLDDFLVWFLLASPIAHHVSAERPTSLMERALHGSTQYRVAVGDALREQVFEALRLCIEGFLSHRSNQLDPQRDIESCRANAFTLLFRLLFILFAEDRALLPYRTNQTYTRNRSLTRQHHELLPSIESNLLRPDGVGVWNYWRDLFDLIDSGHATYGVPAYNGGLFDRAAHPQLSRWVLPDPYAARVLDQLRRARDLTDPDGGRVSVDYRDLAIQHLGNVYEGLLELLPRYAAEPMIVVQKREGARVVEKTVPQSAVPDDFEETDLTYDQGAVYLETDKGERRASGSYYTPDQIVTYIVERTLGPLCEKVDRDLRGEIKAIVERRRTARGARRAALDDDLAQLRAQFDDRVLKLCVVDPAMGSGHFLLRACQYLAEQIATNPYSADPEEPDQAGGDEPTLLFWKRRVIERCIYGVDKNPIAVELAKLALWLETVAIDEPLSFLDHHLRHGNSLIGARLDMMGRLYDARVGPEGLQGTTIESRIPTLLAPLEQIRDMPSATVEQVKEKERLYRRIFEPIRLPFKETADLWVSTFFALDGQALSTAQYQDALSRIDAPGRFEQIRDEEWFRTAISFATAADVEAFHWELEFPEVFLAPGRVREGRAGFDAVIGNPPYDVLAEKELARDRSEDVGSRIVAHLRAFKVFIDAQPLYEPSCRGKNNLYKLFICRALDLLSEGGRLGFIVPMALLGDDQAAGVRRAILDTGAFTFIDAFPQKDDPTQRVFPEAKLSTTVFGCVKSQDRNVRTLPFVSRQHSANCIETVSPVLSRQTDDVPLYDPVGGAIVSCSQVDWDLAVRVMRDGRAIRMGEVCEFFQGEVNETNQRRAGNLRTGGGHLVTRGASVCLYAIRPASQGNDLYLDIHGFLRGASEDSKAYHHRSPRVVLQEASPQNNFRRIIAAPLPRGEFCNHTINYCPEPASRVPLRLLLALLNSRFVEWYFRLGSTNAHVSQYQLDNLPFPRFEDTPRRRGTIEESRPRAAIRSGDLEGAFAAVVPLLAAIPFSFEVADVLVYLVEKIIRVEASRGDIARTARSRLDPVSQPYQNLIDRIVYAIAGLTDDEAHGLEERLATML